MTSLNPFDTRRKSRRRASLLGKLSVVVLCVVVLAAVLYWRQSLANLFWKVAAPVTVLRGNLDSGTVSKLRADLASTSALVADRNALAQENATLKRLLGRTQTSSQILGAVLLRPPGIPYDTLMIDVGSKDGVVSGDVVFAGGSAAIGMISDVYSDTSRVTLFSAPGRNYDAQIAPAANPLQVIPLSLAGQGAGSFSGEVPANSPAAVGDAVLIPGIGSLFLGSVTHIDALSGSSFETLFVQMPVDIFSLRYVGVQTRI